MSDVLTSVRAELDRADLLPSSLIPDKHFEPSVALNVSFHDKSGNPTMVELGNRLTRDQVQTEPKFNFVVENPDGPGQRYVVCMMDPDAPSRENPSASPFVHYIAADVLPASSSRKPHPHPALVPYMAPSPPPGTGRHRYVFLLYKEDVQPPEAVVDWAIVVPTGQASDEPASTAGGHGRHGGDDSKETPEEEEGEPLKRTRFPIDAFVRENKLKLVGVNFFVCEH